MYVVYSSSSHLARIEMKSAYSHPSTLFMRSLSVSWVCVSVCVEGRVSCFLRWCLCLKDAIPSTLLKNQYIYNNNDITITSE